MIRLAGLYVQASQDNIHHYTKYTKDGLLQCERPSITSQKAVFRDMKDGLL